MIVRQRTLVRNGLDAALGGVKESVRSAFETTHERLAEMGIPHALVGGLAVGAHGYQYATQDVDWLVPDSAFEGTTIVTFKPGMIVSAHGVAIDYLTPTGPANVLAAMREALEASEAALDHVIVIGEELLVWMKLKAGRSKDITAVVEMLRAGQIDAEAVFGFLVKAGDQLVLKRFRAAADQSASEE